MKIIIATDAWEPQINGVALTLKKTVGILSKNGHEVYVVHPKPSSLKYPFTKDVSIGFVSNKKLKRLITKPCSVHISTEGPIGIKTRQFCINNDIPYTTAYHTKFPEYFNAYAKVPICVGRKFVNWFHNSSRAVMVASTGLQNEIRSNGIKSPIKIWQRGIDFDLFYPRPKTIKHDKPVALFVGRISKEKNLQAFLNLKLDIHKVVVGDGSELEKYKSLYGDVDFKGSLNGDRLAQAYCNADVFVFPSLSDTFGLVVIEALACGIPVACYPVVGPGEIVDNHRNIGCSSWNLEEAILKSLKQKNSVDCVNFAKKFSWDSCTQQFLDNLVIHD